jgi:hypothetical protein
VEITAPRKSYFWPEMAMANATKAHTGKMAREIESTFYSDVTTMTGVMPTV